MKSLGVIMCVRDVEETDYCWKEALSSVMPIADQVVVCDSESTDGTREILEEMAGQEKKIKIVDWKWPHPKGDGSFVVDWYNHAREQLDTDYCLQNEADEVMHENSHAEMRDLLNLADREIVVRMLKRYNFWEDHRHLAPRGHLCAPEVIRLAPQEFFMPSDSPHPKATDVSKHNRPCTVELFHYGFIRRRKAFFKKSRRILDYFFGQYDPKLEAIEHKPEINWMKACPFPVPLQRFQGSHPRAAWRWLIDRGYGP